MNTFTRDGVYDFDNAPNFGSHHRSSSAHSKSSVVFRVDRFSDLKD